MVDLEVAKMDDSTEKTMDNKKVDLWVATKEKKKVVKRGEKKAAV